MAWPVGTIGVPAREGLGTILLQRGPGLALVRRSLEVAQQAVDFWIFGHAGSLARRPGGTTVAHEARPCQDRWAARRLAEEDCHECRQDASVAQEEAEGPDAEADVEPGDEEKAALVMPLRSRATYSIERVK